MAFEVQRKEMIEKQLKSRGIQDGLVLKAMEKVERHRFVEEALRSQAYEDRALPIGHGQTISQPYMVAIMTQSLALRGKEKILEVGTGSGYQAAVLAEICEKVFTIERNPDLARRARAILDQLGSQNIALRVGDGTMGWKEFSPFDGIMITAGSPVIPSHLIEQLKIGGKLVIPVGDRELQRLKVLEKFEDGINENEVCDCTFVPLIGREGWKE